MAINLSAAVLIFDLALLTSEASSLFGTSASVIVPRPAVLPQSKQPTSPKASPPTNS